MQDQELIEESDRHYWIQRCQITLEKLVPTLQQTEIFWSDNVMDSKLIFLQVS